MNLMQFLIPIVSPIVQIILFFLGLLLAPVVEIRSLSDLNYNVEALLRETENLKSKRDDVLGTIQQGKRQGKTTTNKAENWLEDVNNVLVEVHMIKLDFDQKKTILNGHFTNYIARYELARRAVRKLDDVKELNKKSLDDLIIRPPPPRVVPMPTTATNSQTTSQRTVDEIWQCLQDDENWIICVYGMGGVGKTTLMKSVNNRLIGTQDFDVVMWITVSKEFNMERIQKEIGNSLGVYFSDDEPKRVILFSALKDLKYMLILDDLWDEFELEEAGIPKPNGQNGCKIVITTRFIQVGNAIEADKHIRVNTLTSEESWNLFCEKAEYVAHLPQIRPLAEQVATECGGLPLAIITVGCAMRHKEKKELWLDALRSLRGSAPEIPGMEPKVFLSLKLSYDHLDDDKYKHCFLYCALFPEDYNIKIRKLVKLWTVEGLIDNFENLEDASNKGHAIIERINEACLLEDNSKELWQSSGMYVKMHDLIRDLAIWITSPRSHEEAKFLVRVHAELKVPPRVEMWEEMQRISLMWNEIEELPIQPNCPKLVSLWLKNNLKLKIIPNSFFELMPKLQVLDLSYTAIQSLPMSLSLLVNLRALILKHCRSLVVLPPFGELKELEFVDLSCSAISNLPKGFGNLAKLKKLNLSSLDWLRRIPHNVISRLSNLEDLKLLKTCVNWASDAVSQEVSSATLGEAATLKRLTTFKITIPDIDCLEHDVFHRCWPSLRKFTFYIGSDNWFSDKLCCEKSVQIYGCDHFPHGSKVMIEHAEALGFEKCSGLTRVSQVAGNSKNLRQLHIHDFTGMNCVIDWRDVGDGALQRLEMLYLDQLLNLKTLFEGAVPQRSLRNLRSIEVSICGKLRCLFSSSVIEHLELLEELKVRSCYEMEEIVEGDMLPDNAFPRLRELRLERLYKLTRIISSTASAFTSLQKMDVYGCSLLKKLPFFTSIQTIKGESKWWDSIEWEDEHKKSFFHQKFQQWALPQGEKSSTGVHQDGIYEWYSPIFILSNLPSSIGFLVGYHRKFA